MMGRQLWNKGDQRLKEIFGTKKDFGWPACNSSRGFLSNGTCERLCIQR